MNPEQASASSLREEAVDTSLPFPELKKRGLINERAKDLDKSPDFSKLFSVGLPGIDLVR